MKTPIATMVFRETIVMTFARLLLSVPSFFELGSVLATAKPSGAPTPIRALNGDTARPFESFSRSQRNAERLDCQRDRDHESLVRRASRLAKRARARNLHLDRTGLDPGLRDGRRARSDPRPDWPRWSAPPSETAIRCVHPAIVDAPSLARRGRGAAGRAPRALQCTHAGRAGARHAHAPIPASCRHRRPQDSTTLSLERAPLHQPLGQIAADAARSPHDAVRIARFSRDRAPTPSIAADDVRRRPVAIAVDEHGPPSSPACASAAHDRQLQRLAPARAPLRQAPAAPSRSGKQRTSTLPLAGPNAAITPASGRRRSIGPSHSKPTQERSTSSIASAVAWRPSSDSVSTPPRKTAQCSKGSCTLPSTLICRCNDRPSGERAPPSCVQARFIASRAAANRSARAVSANWNSGSTAWRLNTPSSEGSCDR